jgi:hypothetical protein
MKKLLMLIAMAALMLAPFADFANARGGRGGRRGGSRNIGGASRTAGKAGSKEAARQRDLDKAELEDSLVDGLLRRRGR